VSILVDLDEARSDDVPSHDGIVALEHLERAVDHERRVIITGREATSVVPTEDANGGLDLIVEIVAYETAVVSRELPCRAPLHRDPCGEYAPARFAAISRARSSRVAGGS